MTCVIRIVVADDHTILREALAQQFDRQPDMQVVATAANADEAVQQALEHQPDVTTLDINMPGREVFDAASVIKTRCPQVRLVILSAFLHDRYIEQALQVGVSSFVAKTAPLKAVVKAVRTVAGGGTYFSPEVEERLVVRPDGLGLDPNVSTRSAGLTPQQVRVLCALAQGISKKETARLMHLSERTVERHSENLMAKLNIHNRVELTRFAIREGFIDP